MPRSAHNFFISTPLPNSRSTQANIPVAGLVLGLEAGPEAGFTKNRHRASEERFMAISLLCSTAWSSTACIYSRGRVWWGGCKRVLVGV